MKHIILIIIALVFSSCGALEISPNTQSLTYENNLEGFNKFAKDFEVIITDSVAVSSINKSNLSYTDLETINFIDTNGLVERIPNKTLLGAGEFELNSYFEFKAGDEVFESSIIYYFNYDSISKSFVIVDMMMAD